MKIEQIGQAQVIIDNSDSKHDYFAWPSVARLQSGKIAVVASGFRCQHICPFGKAVIAYSEDEGETYTRPAAVIDTPLDDRDAGITTFGDKGVAITSFNNTRHFQRGNTCADKAYSHAYLDTVTDEEEEAYVGSLYRFSRDGGITWEKKLYKAPITSPHGPVALKNGKLLWVGRTYSPGCEILPDDHIAAYEIDPQNGDIRHLGRIPAIDREERGKRVLMCEPHAIELPNGDLLCHIRVQGWGPGRIFTVYQTVSKDGGYTWSEPEQVLGDHDGSPAHLFLHSSGVLVSTYGVRKSPYGIHVMLSRDLGKTWDIEHVLWNEAPNDDVGYPCTIELQDGSLLTVFYGHFREEDPCMIMQQKWRIVE